MGTKSEIFRTANLLVQEYGEMAPAGANIRADQLAERGNNSGRAVWLRIASAAEDLLSEHRPEDAPLH
jgi:hypothetical protein